LGYWEEYKDANNQIKNRFIGGVDVIENSKDNDKLFAFLVGQFARYMLSLSKAKRENLTHADFAGFLDWHNSKLLKEYVLDIFQKYAHEIRYSSQNGKVENAVSIIQNYKDDLEMDSVKEYLIAGYFSNNQIRYQDNNTEESEDE
jgi:CRISPR-associated protein Csh1